MRRNCAPRATNAWTASFNGENMSVRSAANERAVFDSSVLIAALLQTHPQHAASLALVGRAVRGECKGLIANHTALETYSVLTRLPLSPRLQPALARRMIFENFERRLTWVALNAADYRKILQEAGDLGIAGGAVYDLIPCWVAKKSRADRLYTWNTRDFLRLWPAGQGVIATPG